MPCKSFLGIRSGFELGNGLSNYSSYVSKAKFLGTTALGICERNTLAGVLEFQGTCLSNDIKPIIGMTIPVKDSRNNVYDIKVYAKDFQGWLALLKFNEIINVDEQTSIGLDVVDYYKEYIYIIADPKSMPYNQLNSLFDFYQLDTTRFLDPEKDAEYLDNLEQFIRGDLEPISITDSFYLEQEDFQTREFMWVFLKTFDERTDNQYFKNKDQYGRELVNMFGDKSFIKLFRTAIANEKSLVENCNFVYDTNTRHLPKYEMTDEEIQKHGTKNKLFTYLIKKGLKEHGLDVAEYLDRIKEEVGVFKAADVIDYFLSQYDVMRWAKNEGMLTGIGRGSAGGSLISYLLGITRMNPTDFDLLFERFLNKGRMGSFEERPEYTIETDTGETIVFQEGDLVRIKRDNRETAVFIEDLKDGDEIVSY